MSTTAQPVTATDLLRISAEGRGKGKRFELVLGELREMSLAGFEHGRVIVRITRHIAQHVDSLGLGVVVGAETGFVIAHDPDTVRAPDVAFVSKARDESVGRVAGYWPGAPDLAIEVISPSDRFTDVEDKVHRLSASDSLDGDDVVAGWKIPLEYIFA